VLQRVAGKTADPLARFCAFFHDIGKLTTNPALYPKHHGHDEAGFRTAEEFSNRLRLPAAYRKGLSWVSRLHGKLNRWDELRDSKKLEVAEQAVKAGIADVLPLVSAADKPGNTIVHGWDDAVAVACMATAELGIMPQQLETVPVKNRGAYIFQKRVEIFKAKFRQQENGKEAV
jgi:tRNA nucleotidyltransferase (CCA-adding enzyme)